MKKLYQLLTFLFATTILLMGKTPVFATENIAGATAQIHTFKDIIVDRRVVTLRAFLHEYNSPLEDKASTFIAQADRYSIDWKLVAAIAGTESTFGKHIPSGSYNAWGWGIPTGAQSGVAFSSWEDGIGRVSEGLRKNYINKGAKTLDAIGDIYAASPMWSTHVQFFIDKINGFTPTDPQYLDVTI